MKIFAFLAIIFLAFQVQAACRCSCDLKNRGICASAYDLDHPCVGKCQAQDSITPLAKTACPTLRVFNEDKNVYEWVALCWE